MENVVFELFPPFLFTFFLLRSEKILDFPNPSP